MAGEGRGGSGRDKGGGIPIEGGVGEDRNEFEYNPVNLALLFSLLCESVVVVEVDVEVALVLSFVLSRLPAFVLPLKQLIWVNFLRLNPLGRRLNEPSSKIHSEEGSMVQ